MTLMRKQSCVLRKWDPDVAEQHPVLRDIYEEVRTKGALVWMTDGKYITENEAIKAAVSAFYHAIAVKARMLSDSVL